MGSLFLKVEVFAGCSEEAAAAELADLAGLLRITVEAGFNGVTMTARLGQTSEDVLAEYRRDLRLSMYPQD